MASVKPRSLQSLGRISGLGRAKLERYGQAFLQLILAQVGDAPEGRALVLDDEDTYQATLKLVLEGHSVARVAAMRSLKLNTIETHLAELVQRGKLTVEEATGLDREELERVRQVWLTLPQEERPRLKPLYEKLGERYSYGMLRCMQGVLVDG
jgi:ATP-dependent DNA helicase RecQ